MKKLMFTAIALVAFSGVSMANAIDDVNTVTDKYVADIESLDYYKSVNELIEDKGNHTECCLQAADFLELMDNFNTQLTDIQAHDLFQCAYDHCMVN